MKIRILGRAGLLAAFVFLVGCQSMDTDRAYLDSVIWNIPEDEPCVTLNPGDEIDVKFYNTPELNETQTVRPDGCITVQLVGDVKVKGKTPTQVSEHLLKLLSPRLNKPEVAVIVRSLANRKVYVGGEVLTPSVVPIPGRVSALEAIMQAGGFNQETAECDSVVIIRHKDGQRYGCTIDLDTALAAENYAPFYLAPNDIVYVPPTSIVQVTQWIDQHINRIIPLGFTLTEDRGDSTIGFSKYGSVGTIR